MRVAVLICRILLGLVFVVSGLNGFVEFLHGTPPPGLPAEFMHAMVQSHFVWVVSLAELAGGLLLLANRYVPLGLTLLGPVVVCIVAFHLTMAMQGLVVAVVIALLWGMVFWSVRGAFAGVFAARWPVEGR